MTLEARLARLCRPNDARKHDQKWKMREEKGDINQAAKPTSCCLSVCLSVSRAVRSPLSLFSSVFLNCRRSPRHASPGRQTGAGAETGRNRGARRWTMAMRMRMESPLAKPKSWRFGDYLTLSLSLIMEEWQQDFWGRVWLALAGAGPVPEQQYSGASTAQYSSSMSAPGLLWWADQWGPVAPSTTPTLGTRQTLPLPGFDKSSLHVFVCVTLLLVPVLGFPRPNPKPN